MMAPMTPCILESRESRRELEAPERQITRAPARVKTASATAVRIGSDPSTRLTTEPTIAHPTAIATMVMVSRHVPRAPAGSSS